MPADSEVSQPEVLSQAFNLGFTYTRSTGPVVGGFLTALRRGQIIGVKASDGRVIVPAVEYDPITAEALSEFVDVADVGVVKSWCWVSQPHARQPLDGPFAWAMIQLDGADTPLLHAVDTGGDATAMATGMSVRVRWAETSSGTIRDIVCFEPGDSSAAARPKPAEGEPEAVTLMEAPTYLDYNFTAGSATTRFLQKIRRGKIVGQRCPCCSKVYVPPRGSCAACGVATNEEIECPNTAVVESFTIVHIPIPGNEIEPPYVVANLVVEGADLSFIHLLSECDNGAVHIGMRVEAVWKPESEWGYAMENIRYWKPLPAGDSKGGA